MYLIMVPGKGIVVDVDGDTVPLITGKPADTRESGTWEKADWKAYHDMRASCQFVTSEDEDVPATLAVRLPDLFSSLS
tara:strand:+ start:326 stop:559 length:234 start_codon:yes stop_codon:yes gene_type:complete